MRNEDINLVKNFLVKYPSSVLVKNKYKLNAYWMKRFFPEIGELDDKVIYSLCKKIVNFDRIVRKAKELLKEERKIDIDTNEATLLTLLQDEKKEELGY